MNRLVTQFDPAGTQSAEAAIPGGCCGGCCCCCCCCVATAASISAFAAIQSHRKAKQVTPRPAHAGWWVALAAVAMLAALAPASGAGYLIANARLSSSGLSLFGFGIVGLIAWFTLLWVAFSNVGYPRPGVRSAIFVVVGAVCLTIEFFLALFLVLSAFLSAIPVYVILALGAIGLVVWFTLRPLRNFTESDGTPPGPSGGPEGPFEFRKPPDS